MGYSNNQGNYISSMAHTNGQETAFHGNMNVQPMKPVKATPTGYRDWPFAVLFLINVLAIISIMGIWGFDTLKSNGSSNDNLFSDKDAKVFLSLCGGVAAFAAVLSLILIRLMVNCAGFMITFALWFNVCISFAVAIMGLLLGNIFIGIFGLIIAVLMVWYAYSVRHRIPFAKQNLIVACSAIKKHGSTHGVAFIMLIVQIIWVFIWAIAFAGLTQYLNLNNNNTTITKTNSNNNSLKSTSYVAYFFMLLSFFFGLQVFKNVAHTTVAGTVATWWFSNDSKGATGSSFRRSCTTSFGSICFGSLIVAVIQTLRQLAEEARRNGDCLACIAECILGCIQSIVEYINRWAFVYVGIYGYNFITAGKTVFELFKSRGFDAIINDDLIGNVLGMISLAVGLLCAGISVAIYYMDTSIVTFKSAPIIFGIVGFFIGAGISIIPLSVIDSSVATVFVCFAEDSAAFARSHPEHYSSLVNAWYSLYPDIMVSSGYYYA